MSSLQFAVGSNNADCFFCQLQTANCQLQTFTITPLFRQLQRMQSKGEVIRTGVIGAGFMGRGIVYQLAKMPGMYPSMIVNRTAERAIEAYELAGFKPKHIPGGGDT